MLFFFFPADGAWGIGLVQLCTSGLHLAIGRLLCFLPHRTSQDQHVLGSGPCNHCLLIYVLLYATSRIH